MKAPIHIISVAAISGFLVSLVCYALHVLGFLTGLPVWLLWTPALIIPAIFAFLAVIILVFLVLLFVFGKADPEQP